MSPTPKHKKRKRIELFNFSICYNPYNPSNPGNPDNPTTLSTLITTPSLTFNFPKILRYLLYLQQQVIVHPSLTANCLDVLLCMCLHSQRYTLCMCVWVCVLYTLSCLFNFCCRLPHFLTPQHLPHALSSM